MSPRDDQTENSVRVVPTPSPELLRRMQEDYQKTGSYRPQDVRKLLGDQTSRVEIGPKADPASFFTNL
jgi:hypothetical protein